MNPPATQKSTAYTEFPAPINNGIRGKPSPALLKKKKKHGKLTHDNPQAASTCTSASSNPTPPKSNTPPSSGSASAANVTYPPPSQFPVSPHPFTNTPLPHTVPELRIYQLWDRPIGPHYTGMFEVNLFTPEQFGAFIPWLVIWRGPLSALLHPNTGEDVRDHSQRATWLGQAFPINLGPLRRFVEAKEKKEGEEKAKA